MSGEALGGPSGGRTAGRIQAVKLASLSDDGESVATDPVHDRFDDGQGDRRRHGSVNRGASFHQHGETSLSGERLRRRHTIGGEYWPAHR